jgi:hypothetical protein
MIPRVNTRAHPTSGRGERDATGTEPYGSIRACLNREAVPEVTVRIGTHGSSRRSL